MLEEETPAPLDPGLAAMLQVFNSQVPPIPSLTPEQARAIYRQIAASRREGLPDVAIIEDIAVPGASGSLHARRYRPSADRKLPTIVMFHGGGFVFGDLDTHDIEGRNLANLVGADVISVEYRLAPEHPFPAAVDDAIAAARWASRSLAELGGDGRLALAGDSAGATLSAVVAQTFRDEGVALAGQLLVYPKTDSTRRYPSRDSNGTGYFLDDATIEWFDLQYAGQADHADPRVSPLLGRLDGLAPALVVVGEYDPLHDEGVAYAEALLEAGTPAALMDVPGMIHGFFTMGRSSAGAQAAVEDICARFAALLGE